MHALTARVKIVALASNACKSWGVTNLHQSQSVTVTICAALSALWRHGSTLQWLISLDGIITRPALPKAQQTWSKAGGPELLRRHPLTSSFKRNDSSQHSS